MRALELFEDISGLIKQTTNMSIIDDDMLVDMTKKLHCMERELSAFRFRRDFRKLQDMIHNAKIDLVTEMRKRGLRLSTLFSQTSFVKENIEKVEVTVEAGLDEKTGRDKVWKAARRKGKNDARSVWYDPKTGKGGAL